VRAAVPALALLVASAAFAEEPAVAPAPEAPEASTAPGSAPHDDAVKALQVQYEALAAENRALREQVHQVERALAGQQQGDLVSYGEVHVAEGEQADEAVSMGADVLVDGLVRGDAVSIGGSVRLGPSGRIEGDAVAIGGEVIVADGGFVGGDRVALGLGSAPAALPGVPADPHHATGALAMASQASGMLDALYQRMVLLLTIAGAGVVTVGLFPQRVARVAADVEERPIRSAIVGVLAPGFLTLFAGLFTILTIGIGSPLGMLVMLGLAAAWLLGFVGFCQAVGDRLPMEHRHYGRWLVFLVGVMVVSFMGSLPWMGWLVVFGVSVIGTGSALATRLGSS